MRVNTQPQFTEELQIASNSTRTQFTITQFRSLASPLPTYMLWGMEKKLPRNVDPPKTLEHWKSKMLTVIINPNNLRLTDDEREELLELKLKEWLSAYKEMKLQQKVEQQKRLQGVANLAKEVQPVVDKRPREEEQPEPNKKRKTGSRLEQLLAKISEFKVIKRVAVYNIPASAETTLTSVDKGKISLLDELNDIMAESVEEVNKMLTDVYNTKGPHMKAGKVSSIYSDELSKFGALDDLNILPNSEEDLEITQVQNIIIQRNIKKAWIKLYKSRLYLRKKVLAFIARLIEKESRFNANGEEFEIYSIIARIERIEVSIRGEGYEETWSYGILLLNIMKWFNKLIITISTSKLTWNHEYHDSIRKLYQQIHEWMNNHKYMKPYANIWRKYFSTYLGKKVQLLTRLSSKSNFSETVQQFCFIHISNYHFWSLASIFHDPSKPVSAVTIKEIQELLIDLGLRNESIYIFPNPWEWDISPTSKRTKKTWVTLYQDRHQYNYKLSEMAQDMWMLYSFKDEVTNENINLDVFKKVPMELPTELPTELPHDFNIEDYDYLMDDYQNDVRNHDDNIFDDYATISPTISSTTRLNNTEEDERHNIMYQQEEPQFLPDEEPQFLPDEESEPSPTLIIPPSSNPQSPEGGELDNGMFSFWGFRRRSEKQYKFKMGRVLGQRPYETVHTRELPSNGEHSIDYFCNIHYH